MLIPNHLLLHICTKKIFYQNIFIIYSLQFSIPNFDRVSGAESLGPKAHRAAEMAVDRAADLDDRRLEVSMGPEALGMRCAVVCHDQKLDRTPFNTFNIW